MLLYQLTRLQREYLERFASVAETVAAEFLQDLKKEASELAKAGNLSDGKVLQQEIDTIKRLYLGGRGEEPRGDGKTSGDVIAACEEAIRQKRVALQAQYVGELEAMEKSFQAEGELEELFATKAERTRFLEKPVLTEKNLVEIPEALRELQVRFLELQDLIAITVAEDFMDQLEQQKRALTVEGKLEEALEAKKNAVRVGSYFLDPPNAEDGAPSSVERLPAQKTNSIGMKMILVRPGEFRMGAGRGESSVAIATPFYIAQTEVTQAQWRRVMESTPWSGRQHVHEAADAAASFVTWNDAVAFCKQLTELERKKAGASRSLLYQLPTEAQWEYSCRAGTQSVFSFGDDPAKLSDYGWWGGHLGPPGNARHEQYAHPVRKKKPNPWQLFDMHGNQWEWCADVDNGGHAVMRGGSWNGEAHTCESGSRASYSPEFKEFSVGFRVVGIPELNVGAEPAEGQGASGAARRDPDARTMEVDANRPWQSAGIVKKGTRLTLSAKGNWVGFPPDGDKLHRFPHDPLPDAPSCALLGRIGQKVFVVGSGTSLTVTQDGTLEFRINDADQFLFDNSGKIEVRIKESRRR